jgi:hypothetical protein
VSSEVQSPQQIRAARVVALELELARPELMLLVGGAMRWDYEIDGPIVVLRRSDLEWELGRPEPTHSKREVIDAAFHIFEAVQSRLQGFAGVDFPVPGRRDPWLLQVLAKRALRDWLEVHEVRSVQRRTAGQYPLTICFGQSGRLAYEAAAGVKGLPAREVRELARGAASTQDLRLPGESCSHGDGCGRTHPESHSPHRLFKLYCDRCSKLAGNRQREVERRAWADLHGRSTGKGTHECSCGRTFESTRTGQFRCPDCARRHREQPQRK